MTALTKTPPESAAPVQLSAEVTVHLPIETVFEYVAELRNAPNWNRAIGSCTPLTKGPIEVGARFQQTRTVPRHAREFVEVTAYEANEMLEICVEGLPDPVRYRYSFGQAGADSTRVRLTVTTAPSHPVGRPDFYSARLSRVIGSSLNNLRTALMSTARQ